MEPEAKRYTLADLEAAERNAREGDSGRHSNPGRTRRWNRQADEEVSRIRAALIQQGDLPDPQKSPEAVERRRVEAGLLAICPDPDHNQVVSFDGESYRCKYYKVSGSWFRKWHPA